MLTSVIKGVKYGQAFLVMLIALALFAVPVLAGTGAGRRLPGVAHPGRGRLTLQHRWKPGFGPGQ